MAEPKTPKAPKSSNETKLYKVLSPLDAGTSKHAIGDEIEMSEKQAAELVACGALEAL